MKTASDLLKHFCTAFYHDRDIAEALSLLSDDVFWFGIDESMDAHGITEAERYLEREILRDKKIYEINFFDSSAYPGSTDGSSAAIRFSIESGTLKLTIRATVCTKISDGEKKISMIHMSLATDERQRTDIRKDSGMYSAEDEAEIKEQLLKEMELSNKNFTALLQNISCGVCIYSCGKSGEIELKYMNSGFCDFCEEDKETLVRKFKEDSLLGVCAADRERVKEAFHSTLADGKKREIRYQAHIASGKQKYCSLRLVPVYSRDSSLNIYATFYDVTEQTTAQQELKSVIHNVPGAVCYYRWNGTKLEPLIISDQYSEILGLDAVDSLNKTVGINFRWVHPDDIEGVQNAFMKAIKETNSMNYTYRSYNSRKKKYVWINAQGKSVPQEDGSSLAYVTYTDISKDKEIEQNLINTKKSLEAATEQVGVWYWLYDPKLDFGRISERAQKDFLLPEEMNDFADSLINTGIIESQSADAFRNMLEEIRAGEASSFADCKIHTPDGVPHWCRFQMKNLYDMDENISEAIGTVRFIDDAMEYRQKYELEKQRGQMDDGSMLAEAIFNLSEDTVMELERRPPLKPFTGERKMASFRDDITAAIFDDTQREKFIAVFNRDKLLADYYSGKTEQSVSYRRTLPTGKSIWVNSTFRMLLHPDGRDVILFYYCDDINMKKTTDIMMNFMATDDYDMLGCMNFHDDSVIMLYGKNSSFGGQVGRLSEENYTDALMHFAENAVAPEDKENYIRQASSENVKTMLKDRYSFELTVHVLAAGEIRTKNIRYVRYGNDSDTCLFTQTDITELVREQQKKQDELKVALVEAEQASRSKTSFLSQMSHEIRTPMNAIIGMTQLAQATAISAHTRDYLDKIDRSSHYLLDIINDILDMSRIESGRFELHPEWTPANEMLMTCLDMLSSEMKQKGINFYKPGRDKDYGLEFYVDPLRTKQVLMNLLNNAIKFTPVGGSISVNIETRDIDESHREDTVTIADTGCGMSQDFLKRIFTPFEQEQNAYSASVQGTGLGLALVKQILTASGGSISVMSELGKGSVFVYKLPYKYRIMSQAENSSCEAKPENLEGKRVLLVDDHPLNREIARKLLERKGMIITTAENGKQAVNIFEASEPEFFDCVLMDIRMPVMNGLEATKAIRALNRSDSGDVPIVAMTANAFDDDVRISKEAGMTGHLAKPVEPELLYSSLTKYITEYKSGKNMASV